jgi:hypothetical protein
VVNASTFDWDGARDRYWRSLDWQALVMGSQNRDAVAHRARLAGLPIPVQQKPASGVKNPGVGRGRRYDRKEMARLYVQERKTVAEIMAIVGCKTERTVREALRSEQVYDPKRDLGKTENLFQYSNRTRERRKVCMAGLHDMEKYGREVKGRTGVDGKPKKNGRYCTACQGIRQGADPSYYETVDDGGES